MKKPSSFKSRKPLPPAFDGTKTPLTAKALAKRIAREQLRDDRRTAGLPPSKRSALGSFLDDWEAAHGALTLEELARARDEIQPLPSKTLADHERRLREIENILFGTGLKALRSTLPSRPPKPPAPRRSLVW